MADNQRGPYLAGGFPGQHLVRDQSNRTMWVDSRETLTATRVYVVMPTGSDDADGISMPWKTIQHAMDVAAKLDLNGNRVFITVYPGTYTEQLQTRPIVGGPGYVPPNSGNSINVIGPASDPGLVKIQGPGGAPFVEGILQARHAGWGFSGVTFELTTLGMNIVTFDGCDITLNNTVFRSTIADNMPFFMIGGKITGYGLWAFYSDWGSMMYVQNGSTLVGPPNYYLQENPVLLANTVNAFTGGTINFGSTDITGTATGKRFDATGMSLIISKGGSLTYFPGDAAGTLSGGSQYI